VRTALAAHHDPTLAAFLRHLTQGLSPAVCAVILGLGCAVGIARTHRVAPFAGAAVTGWAMAVVVVTVKHGVDRPSPPGAFVTHGGSYPSGHTASALVCLGALAVAVAEFRPAWERRMLAGIAVLTVVIAVGLVYADFHWVTDTVGSMLLGAGLLGLLRWWLRRRA
jgi:membrane-associated phospholipid phosphatase